jgi:hypothetical protein
MHVEHTGYADPGKGHNEKDKTQFFNHYLAFSVFLFYQQPTIRHALDACQSSSCRQEVFEGFIFPSGSGIQKADSIAAGDRRP